jgi:hypothetical protein
MIRSPDIRIMKGSHLQILELPNLQNLGPCHAGLRATGWDQASTLPISNVGIPALFARFSAGKARHFRHFFK